MRKHHNHDAIVSHDAAAFTENISHHGLVTPFRFFGGTISNRIGHGLVVLIGQAARE